MTNLERLDWRDPEGIKGPGLAHLTGLKKIKKWDLSETGLTDEGLAHIKGWTHFVELNLPKPTGFSA